MWLPVWARMDLLRFERRFMTEEPHCDRIRDVQSDESKLDSVVEGMVVRDGEQKTWRHKSMRSCSLEPSSIWSIAAFR